MAGNPAGSRVKTGRGRLEDDAIPAEPGDLWETVNGVTSLGEIAGIWGSLSEAPIFIVGGNAEASGHLRVCQILNRL